MKLQTSFYNKAILKNNIKRFAYIGILYFVIHFLVVNFGMLMNTLGTTHHMDNLLYKIPSGWDVFILFFLPVILGIVLFRYIQDEKALATIHAFPVSRKTLFFSHMISFVILFGIPLAINTLISYIILVSKGYPALDLALHLSIYYIGMLLSGMTIFYITVMFGMLVGSSVLQAVLTYVMMVIPVAIVEFGKILIGWTLKGFSTYLDDEALHLLMTPYYTIGRMVDASNTEFLTKGFLVIIIYLCFSVMASYVLYKKRHLEKHHDLIAFDFAKIGFIGLLTVLITLTLANMLGSMFYENRSLGVYVGVFFGALIGYGVTKMIAEKTVRIFVYYKSWLVVVALFMLALMVIDFDLIGFESHVPDFEDVAYVVYGENSNPRQGRIADKTVLYGSEGNFELVFTEQPSIQEVLNLHETAIHAEQDRGYNNRVYRLDLVYVLKNGKRISRMYENPQMEEGFARLHESEGYKRGRLKDIKAILTHPKKSSINIWGRGGQERNISLEKSGTLYEAYRKDFMLLSYKEEISYDNWGTIDIAITVGDGTREGNYEILNYHSLNIWPSFENTKAWLRENGYEGIVPNRKDIVSARITPVFNPDTEVDMSPEYVKDMQLQGMIDSVGIVDDDIIDIIYDLTYDYSKDPKDSYRITLIYKDYGEYSFRVGELPEILKSYVTQY
ncbi:hypothetical protein [Petrocella sp. FN5]|uniref:hypothetical protein n=1 Tax=Petrocella sp. FN5 TaxID=3032002 RepID=UPI0023DCC982|nr:hypothetical protein [Petrocella sp. FN5]MDF1615932.1 hypothetical protein [Petrocella sp. FN5]